MRGNLISSFSAIFILFVGTMMTGCGTGLTQAAKEGDIATPQKLLDQGANINESAFGTSIAGPPLTHAACYCRIEAVKYLIQISDARLTDKYIIT